MADISRDSHHRRIHKSIHMAVEQQHLAILLQNNLCTTLDMVLELLFDTIMRI